MKRSGTTHLVALSGYNVSILVLAIHGLLLGLISRRTLFWIICVMVIVFSILTGAESSIVRAAIMGILMLSARELGRMPSFGMVLLWTALFMYLWNPGVLFEIGFLLSFASLLGISYIPGALRNFFRLKEGKFTDYILLTLGAQLATLPVIALVFEEISWLSLAANLLILPAVPVLMGFGFVFLAISVFSPFLAWFLGAILRAALGMVLWIMHGVGGLAPQLSLNGVSAVLWAMYAASLILLIWKYGRKQTR